MAVSNYIIAIGILLAVAFIPSIWYTVKIRNVEQYSREPWGAIAGAFTWGAFIATITAIFLSFLLIILFGYGLSLNREYSYLAEDPALWSLILACVVAPFVEEFTKGVGVFMVGKHINEVEDGLIYGAASGLGFAATENLLYESSALLTGGLAAYIAVAVVRTISSSLLHASATAMTGYGVSRHIVGGSRFHIIPWYLLAVGMHALFNLFASFSVIAGDTSLPIFGLFLAIFFAWSSYGWIKKRIRALDTIRSGRY